MHRRVIPESVALNAGPGRARRSAAAETELGLRAEALVAEQDAGIVTAADGIIAGGELLEAEERLPRILCTHAKRERQLRHWAKLTISEAANDRRSRPSVEPAWRNVIGTEAVRASRPAEVRSAENVESLAQLKQSRHAPARFLERVTRVGKIVAERIDAETRERDPQPIAGQWNSVEPHVLVDVIQARRPVDGLGLPAVERIIDLERPEQSLGKHLGVGDVRPRPRISEETGDRESFGAEPEIVPELDRLLLVKIGRAEHGHSRAVAETGQSEQLRTQQPAPRTKFMRALVLHVEIDISRRVLDGDVADHIAGCAAGRPQGQTNGVAGQIARQQQVPLGFVAVEHRLLGQLAEVAGDHPLGARCVAAYPHLRQMRHQYAEADDAIGNALLGDLDGGDIAGVPQDGRSPVPDFADDRDRLVVADV